MFPEWREALRERLRGASTAAVDGAYLLHVQESRSERDACAVGGFPHVIVLRILTEDVMKMESLEDLLVHELKDLYNAENQLLKALPKMSKAASSDELKKAFDEHTHVTENQVQRLEKVFNELGHEAKGKKCHAMEGLIEEGQEIIKDKKMDSAVKDAALIAAAQKVEHYEIAGYGSVKTFAGMLGRDNVKNLLQETLDEESRTDQRLTKLAESSINLQAAQMQMADE
jgi:ferritin-like metal-binding protein YciE